MGWLKRPDERNQYTANWLMDHPEAGTEMFPLAKSRRARRVLIALFAAAILAGLILGLRGVIVGFAGFATATFFLQLNPVKERYQRRGKPEST